MSNDHETATLDELDYYKEYIIPQLNKDTGSSHKTAIKKWINWFENDEPEGLDEIDDLEPPDVDISDANITHVYDFIKYLDEIGYAGSTILTYKRSLSSIYKTITETDDNIISVVDIPDKIDTEPQKQSSDLVSYISKEQYEQLIDIVEDPRDEIIISTLYHTGMRASELCRIKIDQYEENRDGNKIWIQSSKRKNGDKPHYRFVYYPTTHRYKLDRWLQEHRHKYNPDADKSPYLITRNKSPDISNTEISGAVRRAAEKSGIQTYVDYGKGDVSGVKRGDVTAHSLRHTYAVLRAKKGMSLSILKDLLGHAHIETTQKYYLRFGDDDKAEAYRKYSP